MNPTRLLYCRTTLKTSIRRSKNLSFSVQNNENVFVNDNSQVLTGFVISHKTGFAGTETVYMQVYDVNPASSDVDTFTVTVGAKPPVFNAGGLPDTVIFSETVPIPDLSVRGRPEQIHYRS